MEREAFRLLEGYCLELEENRDAARERYRSVISALPSHMLGYEAAHRILALERAPRAARLREELKRHESESQLQSIDPRPLFRVEPVYPVVLREAGIEGWVLANFGISAHGSTYDVVILESDPPFVFDSAVLAAIRNWIYTATAAVEKRRRSVRWVFEIAPKDRPAR